MVRSALEPARAQASAMATDAMNPPPPEISHPRFSAFYEWLSERPRARRYQDPWRRELVSQAHGLVLEVGAGGGQTFRFYDARRVSRIEATEPDPALLVFARRRLALAPVPIHLTQAAVESLPFPDGTFDCAVAAIVFCSVRDPGRGLREVARVLKPQGDLLMLEHVRSHGPGVAWAQDALVPLTTRLSGNCHWNRDTDRAVRAAGFHVTEVRALRGGLQPVLMLRAKAP